MLLVKSDLKIKLAKQILGWILKEKNFRLESDQYYCKLSQLSFRIVHMKENRLLFKPHVITHKSDLRISIAQPNTNKLLENKIDELHTSE